jgi:hypothetical protein
VFRRDGWICHLCRRPVIFAPVMRHIERFVRMGGVKGPLAYHHDRWRRDRAPLLDDLGAVIDHVEPHSRKGSIQLSNLATACNKCNARKSATAIEEHRRRAPVRPIRGKYGEPTDWDGLSALFVMFAEQGSSEISPTEREWLEALKEDRTT